MSEPTNHVLWIAATDEEKQIARDAADWMIDALATSLQARRYLRGEDEYDELVGEVIISNTKIAVLRALTAKDAEKTAAVQTAYEACAESLDLLADVFQNAPPDLCHATACRQIADAIRALGGKSDE